MKPNPKFLMQSKEFWANIRTISQATRYTLASKKREEGKALSSEVIKRIIKVPTAKEIRKAYTKLGLSLDHILDDNDSFTDFGNLIQSYFQHRADVLTYEVEPMLMNAEEAKTEFEKLFLELDPKCPLPMNKQKGEKKAKAYFTCIINMLIEANAGGIPCNYDPQQLTTITRSQKPLRTLARRVDGAFPGIVNPVAMWEIKEYYYTKTFGSRVADGVYETLLDGMELEELFEKANVKIKHYLMIDARFNWWSKGISYLCRIVDMLHMGYVDEVLCGREVITRLPELVREWVPLVVEIPKVVYKQSSKKRKKVKEDGATQIQLNI